MGKSRLGGRLVEKFGSTCGDSTTDGGFIAIGYSMSEAGVSGDKTSPNYG
ncbi:MAG: hypothetical protein V9F05_12740 [Chitinophagaceae bacterium]